MYLIIYGLWIYLNLSVYLDGNLLVFMISAKRDAKATKRFYKKVLNAVHTVEPRGLTADENAAYLPAIEELKAEGSLPKGTKPDK